MNKITHIIVHCSDSPFGSVDEIRAWHQAKGWKDIGYHFVVLNGRVNADLRLPSLDGSIECGRSLDGDAFLEDNEVGAHTLGYNESSLGVCLIGMKDPKSGVVTFTIKQFEALKGLLSDLCKHYGVLVENVLGHRETESGKAQGKTCPDFDVAAFRTWLKGRI